MLEVLKFKFSLFSGVLDNGANEIFMGESKFKKFMSSVEKMAVAPMTTVPVTDVEATLDPELARRMNIRLKQNCPCGAGSRRPTGNGFCDRCRIF